MLPAIKDYRALACRRLSRFAFDYLEGGAEDGRSMARNLASWGDVTFLPRAMVDVSQVDTSIELFGRKQAMPAFVGRPGSTACTGRKPSRCWRARPMPPACPL